MLTVIISNFHQVVKFTNALFNFSSVSLSKFGKLRVVQPQFQREKFCPILGQAGPRLT